MLNAEKYRVEIFGKDCDFGLSNRIHGCCYEECATCVFSLENNPNDGLSNACTIRKVKWLLSEYKEPVKLTRFEYFILDWLLNSQYVRYIARDRNGNLYAHINKPCRVKYEWRGNVSAVDLTIFGELFAFVKWQNTEPTPIKDVLDNCEVVESDL